MHFAMEESTWISDARRGGAWRWMVFAEQIRQFVAREGVAAGRYLPGERTLATQYGVSMKTVRRGLAALASEGVLAIESRKGYRVLPRDTKPMPDARAPLSFVFRRLREKETPWFYQRMLGELQMAADRQGFALLGMNGCGHDTAETIQRLRTARVGGVVLDADAGDLLPELQSHGIPVVLADVMREDGRFDSVMQDGFAGGFAAGRWLAGRGHKRVTLLHHELHDSAHAVARYGGAAAGLAAAGIFLSRQDLTQVKIHDEPDAFAKALKLLGAKEHPRAVLALWQGMGEAMARAAAQKKLKIGYDFDLVSWSTEEDYETHFVPMFPVGQTPAAIVWRVADMAERCIALLAQRRMTPGLPAMNLRVATRLKLPVKKG
jgi:DNA-binding LacI/PurR family transcriptional regulator